VQDLLYICNRCPILSCGLQLAQARLCVIYFLKGNHCSASKSCSSWVAAGWSASVDARASAAAGAGT
jgi:hypothetical protein